MHSITSVPLADIARTTPSSTRVFLRHHLDFCCGGRRTLAEACARVGLDPVAIAAEVEQEARNNSTELHWDERSPSELCDYIEARFHAALRRDVPPLIEAARKVERVHAEKPDVPTGLTAVLSEFFSEMEHHMAKEERVLFPMIRRGIHGEAMYMPVSAMESEHEMHREALRAIRTITDDLRIPDDACATWRALYEGLEAMEADLMQHIHLENNILFSRALL
jgi:regulator of cell morphogenesis and NO signaling